MVEGYEQGYAYLRENGVPLTEKLKPDTKMVILDAVGTFMLAKAERTGLKKFLKYCRNNRIKVVVATDTLKDALVGRPEGKLVMNYASNIYTRASGSFVPSLKESIAGGALIKDLAYITNHCSIRPEDTVMLGDSGADGLAAKLAGIEFILVPPLVEFDFTSVLPLPPDDMQ